MVFLSPDGTNMERLRRSGTKTGISCLFFITEEVESRRIFFRRRHRRFFSRRPRTIRLPTVSGNESAGLIFFPATVGNESAGLIFLPATVGNKSAPADS
jgi:hypothetical protein